MQFNSNINSKVQTVGCKLGLTIFFLIFFLMGSLFLTLMGQEFCQCCAPYFWKETPCTIISSKIIPAKNSESDNEFKVQYNYRYKNRNYTCDKFSSKDKVTENARHWKQKYTKGLKTKCYVNPDSPGEAVINRSVEWLLFAFLLIPLVFVAIGGGGIYGTWKKEKIENISSAAAVGKRKSEKQLNVPVIFFAVFFIIGGSFGWLVIVNPLLKIKESEKWSKKPCKIISSRVKVSHDNDGSAYKVDIAFKYQFSGKKYISSNYDFVTGSDNDYSSKQQVVDHYPVGKSAYCYVNPENPAEAVISREFNTPWWVAGLASIFMLVGAGGMIGTLLKKKKCKHIYLSNEKPGLNLIGNDGEIILKMKSSPLKNLIGTLFAAVFWNGIVSIFVVIAVESWQTGHVEWFLTLFMIPFVLFGLALIGRVIYCFIALFNSKVVVTISNPRPQPGEKVTLSWKIMNSTSIDKLEIFLKAEEIATYQTQGKDNKTHTSKSTFELLTLLNTSNHDAIHIGETQFIIPSNTMHSFDGKNNKITWEIVLHGNIKRRPDLRGEYPISVMPLNQESLHRISRSTEYGDDNE